MIRKIHSKLESWLTDARRATLQALGLLALRLGVGGGMLLGHGLGKLQAYGEKADSFPDPLGVGSPVSMALAIFAEVVCSLLVVLGLTTRAALLPLITTMLVALLIVHGGDPWAKKELAFVYLTGFTSLLFLGPGRFSFDNLITKRLRSD